MRVIAPLGVSAVRSYLGSRSPRCRWCIRRNRCIRRIPPCSDTLLLHRSQRRSDTRSHLLPTHAHAMTRTPMHFNSNVDYMSHVYACLFKCQGRVARHTRVRGNTRPHTSHRRAECKATLQGKQKHIHTDANVIE